MYQKYVQQYYKLKAIIFILSSLLCLNVLSMSKGTILTCLGKEEFTIHKAKSDGPLYQLNQKLINRLSATPDIRLKSLYLHKICDQKDFAPSLLFLKYALFQGTSIFILRGLNAYQRELIIGLLNEVPHLFFAYLSTLQSKMATAGCLEKYIPSLNYFYERYKYLEIDLPAKKLINDFSKIDDIFIGLKKLDTIMKQCQQDKVNADKKVQTRKN